MSAPVVLYLVVNRSQSLGTVDALWTRTLDMAFLPAPVDLSSHATADAVTLFPSADDPEDPDEGELWPVRRRYWRFDGTTVLELVTMQVDPIERLHGSCDGAFRKAWWTRPAGDPEQLLAAAGWAKS